MSARGIGRVVGAAARKRVNSSSALPRPSGHRRAPSATELQGNTGEPAPERPNFRPRKASPHTRREGGPCHIPGRMILAGQAGARRTPAEGTSCLKFVPAQGTVTAQSQPLRLRSAGRYQLPFQGEGTATASAVTVSGQWHRLPRERLSDRGPTGPNTARSGRPAWVLPDLRQLGRGGPPDQVLWLDDMQFGYVAPVNSRPSLLLRAPEHSAMLSAVGGQDDFLRAARRRGRFPASSSRFPFHTLNVSPPV